MKPENMWKLCLSALALANLAACVTVEQVVPPSSATSPATEEDAGEVSGDSGIPLVEVEQPDAAPFPRSDASFVDAGKKPTCQGAGTPDLTSDQCFEGVNPSDGGALNSATYCPLNCGGGTIYFCVGSPNTQPLGASCYVPPYVQTDVPPYVCCL